MSTTRSVNVPTPGQPAVVPLPSDHLACGGCGVAVPVGGEVSRVAVGERWEQSPGLTTQRHVTDFVDLGICDSCAALRLQTAQVVADHRTLQRDLGGLAFERVEGALLALDVLGTEPPAFRSAVDALQLVSFVHGSGVRFEALQRKAVGVCASRRWAHVSEEARASLRDAVARVFRARTAPAADPLGPPVDSALRGCLMCGVDRSDVWEAIVVSTRALGGKPTPEPLEGDLCTRCADAVQSVGSVGRTSMVRALFAHLGIPRRNVDEVVEVHVVGFGALPAGTRPTSEPWQHVDTSALVEDLRSAGVA